MKKLSAPQDLFRNHKNFMKILFEQILKNIGEFLTQITVKGVDQVSGMIWTP